MAAYTGLPYFRLDTVLDEKFELLEAEFGIKGYAVVVKLYQYIYSRGCYCLWTKDYGLLFSQKIGVGYDLVSEIVCSALRRGIFDEQKFKKYDILTSHGIQKNYFSAISRRKIFEIEKDYLLLSVDNLPDNVNINAKNVDINGQRIEKNRIEENTKKNARAREADFSEPGFPSLEEVKFYCESEPLEIDAEKFWHYYQSRGWRIRGSLIRDWKAAAFNWYKKQIEMEAQHGTDKRTTTSDKRDNDDDAGEYRKLGTWL
jgi:hypothetical protein